LKNKTSEENEKQRNFTLFIVSPSQTVLAEINEKIIVRVDKSNEAKNCS